MNREEAATEAARKQAEDPASTWTAIRRGDEWAVARIGLAPPKTPSGTATRPPPDAPQEGPRDTRPNIWGAGA